MTYMTFPSGAVMPVSSNSW